ncbi:poly [ADP-ribose] [Lates japonicus]|uniref:Poly [ADP-ribose] n=1 Tax=Lates japonicus TaxID=270547 RepID=A0AAD3M6F6_LATJO|nr:poly [ADP-ribose] [Lates japonicus]
MESEILKFICASEGAVNTVDLVSNLDSTTVSEIICNREKFVVCCPKGQPKVVAWTKLRLCRAKDCQGTCSGLHLCKNFLFSGSCHFTRLRRGCNFSHELNSDHNERVLREHELESLSRAELCTLLLQSDNTLLPPICHDYNNGDGVFGRCTEGDGCKRLHICERYLNDNKNTDNENGPNKRQRPVRDKTEICMYFIKGHCKHEDKCYKAHDKMPYRWEVKEGDQWTALPENEAIEKDYCDPKNTYSGSTPPVHFDTMTCGQNKVRRLSTTNSLLEPTFIHTTVWLWYWEDEFGKWNMYASASGGHKEADMDSTKLEQKFLENDKDVVEFTAGSQSYSLSFQDMIQTNKHYGTKRLVKRRPQFVSAADVLAKRVRRPLGQPNFCTIPDHWDKTQIPATGYKRVSLQRSSDEFKEIEALFCKTMRGFDIIKIERIQNKALWEVFQWQKNQMKSNNFGCNVTEKKLFHGTDSKHVDAICLTNFDWRICGTHGTAFGKGSYFARDAKYSHSYTGDSDIRSMFVSRVLVGDFTRGSSSYCRPPSKDGGDVNFYHSCVDDVINPAIFVVFEKHQIYPEYLLQYKTLNPFVAAAASCPGCHFLVDRADPLELAVRSFQAPVYRKIWFSCIARAYELKTTPSLLFVCIPPGV